MITFPSRLSPSLGTCCALGLCKNAYLLPHHLFSPICHVFFRVSEGQLEQLDRRDVRVQSRQRLGGGVWIDASRLFGGVVDAGLANQVVKGALPHANASAPMGHYPVSGPHQSSQGSSIIDTILSEDTVIPSPVSAGPRFWQDPTNGFFLRPGTMPAVCQQTAGWGQDVASGLLLEILQAPYVRLTSGQDHVPSAPTLQEPPRYQGMSRRTGIMAVHRDDTPLGFPVPPVHRDGLNTAVAIPTASAADSEDRGPGAFKCPLCPKISARRQERKRHVYLHLPCCVFCPEWGCTWRGDRKDTLQNHLGRKHGISDKLDKAYYIYDAEALATQLINRDISPSVATERARTEVYAKAGVMEVGKTTEWRRDIWGPNRKFVR
ncbi:hypothetical protein BC834DRAFT_97749 [Gloeopeniophorella convolvens]|nr:hypothetical protein BC834DRAFT_97749 [Gloeopeniophorella convolvens]